MNGSQWILSTSPWNEQPWVSAMSLTCSPLFLRSTWRGQQRGEGNKAPWDELPGHRMVGKGLWNDASSGPAVPLRSPSRQAKDSKVPCAALLTPRH